MLQTTAPVTVLYCRQIRFWVWKLTHHSTTIFTCVSAAWRISWKTFTCSTDCCQFSLQAHTHTQESWFSFGGTKVYTLTSIPVYKRPSGCHWPGGLSCTGMRVDVCCSLSHWPLKVAEDKIAENFSCTKNEKHLQTKMGVSGAKQEVCYWAPAICVGLWESTSLCS